MISLGGTAAARISDILSYYSQKPDPRLFVEVYDTQGNRITDAQVQTIKEDLPVDPKKFDDQKKSSFITYALSVTKNGYQPVNEKIRVKPDQISTAKVILAKEHSQHLITAVILTLLAPFIWAAIRYSGLLGNSSPYILDLAIVLFFGLIVGGLVGVKKLHNITLLSKIEDRYVTGIIGLIIGEVCVLVIWYLVFKYVIPLLSFVASVFEQFKLDTWDFVINLVTIISLSFIGLLIDSGLIKGLRRKEFIITLFIALGAAWGGFLGQHLLTRIESVIMPVTTTWYGIEIRNFFPVFVFLFTILWSVLFVRLFHARNLDRTRPILYLALYGILGVILLSLLLPAIIGDDLLLIPFSGGSIIGGLAGLIAYYLLIGDRWLDSAIGSVQEGSGISKRFQIDIVPLVVDEERSRLENLDFIPQENYLVLNRTGTEKVDHNNLEIIERIRKKIQGIYKRNLENCSRLFSHFIIIVDLRYNALCENVPFILSFLRDEYSLPLYTVVITTQDKINTSWMKNVSCLSDTVFPVDYNLFEDTEYLDLFYHFHDDDLITREVYEEGCVVELVQRLCPVLEVSERRSPSGLDVSHINRILNRERIPASVCNDCVDVIPTGNQNIATCGYFSLNIKKCKTLNLELGMGEFLEYALKNTLWKIDKERDSTYALVIIRGAREYLLTGLVKNNMKSLYHGILVATGDLLIDSDNMLEIVILLSYVMDDVQEDPDSGEGCNQQPDTVTPSPGYFRNYWDSLILQERSGSGKQDERYHAYEYDAYTSIVKKYYNRSPLLRYKSVSLAKQYPGAQDWRQAQVIFEWVRDAICYVSDPLDSEYIQLPEETLNNGGGDCDDQAVLLASMLMCIGFTCALVFLKDHVYVAIHLPGTPKDLQTFNKGSWPNNTPPQEWIGCDPTCMYCSFGQLPENDYAITSIELIE